MTREALNPSFNPESGRCYDWCRDCPRGVDQVAVHRHGCCVLQRCLDAAGPKLRTKLVDEVNDGGPPRSGVGGGLWGLTPLRGEVGPTRVGTRVEGLARCVCVFHRRGGAS